MFRIRAFVAVDPNSFRRKLRSQIFFFFLLYRSTYKNLTSHIDIYLSFLSRSQNSILAQHNFVGASLALCRLNSTKPSSSRNVWFALTTLKNIYTMWYHWTVLNEDKLISWNTLIFDMCMYIYIIYIENIQIVLELNSWRFNDIENNWTFTLRRTYHIKKQHRVSETL